MFTRRNLGLGALLAGLPLLIAGACERHPDQPAPHPADSAPPTTAPASKQPAPSESGETPVAPTGADVTAKPTSTPPRAGPPSFPFQPPKPPQEIVSTVGVPDGYAGPNRSIPKDAKPLSRMNAPDGLVIEDYVLGKGSVCLPRAYITLKGIGRFAGTERTFVNDYATGKAVSGNLDNLVPALRDGIVGMRVGGQRRIYAGWNQGLSLFWKTQPDDKSRYGIPTKTDLIYDIELLDSKSRFLPPPEAANDAPAPTPLQPDAPSNPSRGEPTGPR